MWKHKKRKMALNDKIRQYSIKDKKQNSDSLILNLLSYFHCSTSHLPPRSQFSLPKSAVNLYCPKAELVISLCIVVDPTDVIPSFASCFRAVWRAHVPLLLCVGLAVAHVNTPVICGHKQHSSNSTTASCWKASVCSGMSSMSSMSSGMSSIMSSRSTALLRRQLHLKTLKTWGTKEVITCTLALKQTCE